MIDHCATTSTRAPRTHNVIIDAVKPGASQGTYPDRRRCARTSLTRDNFRIFSLMTSRRSHNHGLRSTDRSESKKRETEYRP